MNGQNYILEYYQAIKSGRVTVGRWVRRAYEQIVTGLEERRYAYDGKKAGLAIRFIEGFCRHHEGALAPGKIQLELWQKAFISCVFGLVDPDGSRHFREVILTIGRKNGKTLLAAAISACMMYIDGEYGARVYFVAPKLDQARLCYEAYYQMVIKEPELAGLAQKRRSDIYVAANNSSAMPLAFSAKKSDGLNPHMIVCDEIAAWPGDAGLKQYEVLKSALGARRQPLLLSISTAGYVDDGIYDELIRRATAVLQGDSRETRLLPLLYMIDEPERWDDITELAKANPNLGVSVSVDYMLEEIAIAESSLSKRAEFLAKYCNVKQNSSQAWLTAQEIARCFGSRLTPEDFRHCYALGGIDLSLAVDLTAAVILIERAGVIWFFAHFFLPEGKLRDATARDGLPYEIYARRGLLTLCGENTVDYHAVHDWYRTLEREYEILPLAVGYDRYSSAYLVQEMQAEGYRMESVSQGSNLTGVLIDMEGLIKDGRLRCADDNDLMKIHMLNSALRLEDGTNRRRLVKLRGSDHIDGMAALSDAICMRYLHYDELAAQLSNADRGEVKQDGTD